MKLKNCKFKISLIFLVILVINFTMLEIVCCDSNDIVAENAKIEPQAKEATQTGEIIPEKEKAINMGNFEATAYCICYNCCGKTPEHPAYGITASGRRATPGRTVAVDPRKIPLGSTVIIDGKEYIAEDTGGAIKGNRVDICFDSHASALQYGRRTVEVKVIY